MASVLPKLAIEKIQFCENHVAPWTDNATAIGTTTTAVTDLQTKTTAARSAFNAQQAARQVAKAATEAYHLAVDAMADAASDIIRQVKTKAAISGDAVYALAQIPAPATPSPKPAPGKPFGLVATLDDSGELNLKWKCVNPAGSTGTIYQVWRRVGGEGAAFVYLGGSGDKSFVDATLPAGSSAVTYQIQAVRSTATGPWAQFNVNFGVSGAGAGAGAGGATMVASVVEGVPAKLAA